MTKNKKWDERNISFKEGPCKKYNNVIEQKKVYCAGGNLNRCSIFKSQIISFEISSKVFVINFQVLVICFCDDSDCLLSNGFGLCAGGCIQQMGWRTIYLCRCVSSKLFSSILLAYFSKLCLRKFPCLQDKYLIFVWFMSFTQSVKWRI